MIPGAQLSGALCPWWGLPWHTGPGGGTRQSVGQKTPYEKKQKNVLCLLCLDVGYRDPFLEQGLDGQTFAHGDRLGSAQQGNVGPTSCELTTCRRGQKSQVPRVLGGTLAVQSSAAEASSRDMECQLSEGEGDRDTARAPVQALERRWTLFHTRVADSERQLSRLGFPLSSGRPQFSCWW